MRFSHPRGGMSEMSSDSHFFLRHQIQSISRKMGMGRSSRIRHSGSRFYLPSVDPNHLDLIERNNNFRIGDLKKLRELL
jgi:hypothetical protein